MKKLIIASALIFLTLQSLMAADGEYAVSKIPLNLLKNARAVVRLYEERVELRNLEKMIIHKHYVITILNDKGDRFAEFVEQYDKFNSIESIEGTLYNAQGVEIKSLKKKDITDVSITNENLAVDGRLKTHDFYYKVYPYTIEYEVETIQKETMFFPTWQPVPAQNVSVEKSGMTISVPSGYNLRYTASNYTGEPVITAKDKQKEYNWQITNYEPVIRETYSPSLNKLTPVVITGPSDFIIEDYEGKMSNWKDFGFFLVSLNKGRDVLPDAIKQKVHELVKNAGTRKEKVDLLYQYLQKNTRYISVQLGIGGWRPFEASDVGTKGYGDCKGLSNYMYALLKEAGILSYYTLVRAGDDEDDIKTDFPSSQFNHAIICVPDAKDTIWLECTSQSVSPGYMGKFTGNRHALLITEDGGKLVSTPCYKMNDNLEIRNIKAILADDGTLNLNANTHYSGLQQDDINNMITSMSRDKIKETLHKELDFATYDITQFDYKHDDTGLPSIEEHLNISVSNYATITGKRLFILPNVMTRTKRKLNGDSTRKYDIELDFEYKDVDSVQIELPNGYSPETIPQEISIHSKFGNYACSVKLEADKLYYYRCIEHFGGRFPATDYPDLVKFYDSIYKSDHAKVVLVKN